MSNSPFSTLSSWLSRTASQGFVTPNQAAKMREARDLLAEYHAALEAIAAGDKNPMSVANAALGKPEPWQT